MPPLTPIFVPSSPKGGEGGNKDRIKPRLLITHPVFPEVKKQLERHFLVTEKSGYSPLTEGAMIRLVRETDAVFCFLIDRVNEKVFKAAKKLRIVAQCAVGYDNIDLSSATKHKVAVTNTPGVLTDATADTAWALIMAVTRHLVTADHYVRQGKFQGWRPNLFLGTALQGKTLGIVGFGRIGQALARRALAFDMKIVYCANSPKADAKRNFGAQFRSLRQLLKESDIVSLHTPLTPKTKHLIGAQEIALMKLGAYLINTARGPVVDERALVVALKKGCLAGAGLDVYEEEPELASGLSKLENVVLLPHLGSATIETRLKMAHLAAENLEAFFNGRKPSHCLNPEVLP